MNVGVHLPAGLQEELVTGPRRIGPDHLGDLDLLRSLLRTAVDLESRWDYGEPTGGPRTNCAMFLAHFPYLEEDLALWDVAVARVRSATAALWASLGDAASDRGLQEPEFAVGSVIDRLALLVSRRAREGGLRAPYLLKFERFSGARVTDPATLYMEGQLVARIASSSPELGQERLAIIATMLQEMFEGLLAGREASEIVDARDYLLGVQESLLEHLSIPITPLTTMRCPVCAARFNG